MKTSGLKGQPRRRRQNQKRSKNKTKMIFAEYHGKPPRHIGFHEAGLVEKSTTHRIGEWMEPEDMTPARERATEGAGETVTETPRPRPTARVPLEKKPELLLPSRSYLSSSDRR